MPNDATQPKISRHRGLTADDLPMKQPWKRRYAFALFKRAMWPPKSWKVPADLEGSALKMMLEERCATCNVRKEGR